MKKLLTNMLMGIIFSALMASCSQVELTPSILPTEEKQSASTAFLTPTQPPVMTSTTTPTATQTLSATPYPTTPARATIEAFDSLCIGAEKISQSEISPNGKWIAALCYDENGKQESPLQVVSLDHAKEWKVYFRDYGKNRNIGDRKDGILPYRWTKDERFLYGVAWSKLSGCCWIGGNYILLVRLNLETGEQTEMLNGTDYGSDRSFSFTISEDDRFLLFTPIADQPYDFIVLDVLSWETQGVTLQPEITHEINLESAVMSPYENIIVLSLFKHVEFNHYAVDSIALIDLSLNEQRILVSGLKEDEELFPVRWIDREHVLISSANPNAYHYSFEPPIIYWSLNIKTGEREMVDKP